MLDRIRGCCLEFPAVTERLSHGTPAFFVKGRKSFVMVWLEGHHATAFPHLWCAAPLGAQAVLVDADPSRFFRPPYVGGRGWIGVRLDGDVDWDEVADLLDQAYQTVAGRR
jgi:hypothetical protein